MTRRAELGQSGSPKRESPLWGLLFLWFVLPGLVMGGAGVLTMMQTGWARFAVPAWMLGVYLACVWIAAARVAILRRGGPLPRQLRLRASEHKVSWTVLTPAFAPPAAALILGMADFDFGPQVAALIPFVDGSVFVGLPIALALIVGLQVIDRVQRVAPV